MSRSHGFPLRTFFGNRRPPHPPSTLPFSPQPQSRQGREDDQTPSWNRAQAWLSAQLEGLPSLAPRVKALRAPLIVLDDSHCDGMALSRTRRGRVFLHVHLAALEQAPEQLPGLLRHQLRHLAAGDLDLMAPPSHRDPLLLRIAMETLANEGIESPLPGRPHRWEDYRHLGMTAGQDLPTRYRILLRARRAGGLTPQDCIRLECGCGDHIAPGPLTAPAWTRGGGRGWGRWPEAS